MIKVNIPTIILEVDGKIRPNGLIEQSIQLLDWFSVRRVNLYLPAPRHTVDTRPVDLKTHNPIVSLNNQ